MAQLMMEAEKQRAHQEEMRLIQEKQAAEHAAELKENDALKEKARTQQRLHNQDIQRLKQASVNERPILTMTCPALCYALPSCSA